MGRAGELRTGIVDAQNASARIDYVLSHFAAKAVSRVDRELKS